MAKAKKSKISEERIALRGRAKFFHKLVRCLLFPIFHPFITLIFLLVFWLMPTFLGAKPNAVHLWYGQQIMKVVSSNKQISAIMEDVEGIVAKEQVDNKQPLTNNKIKTGYDVNQRRQMFIKGQGLKDQNSHKKTEINLRYLQKPEIIKGKAAVLDANRLMINNTVMFIYGVYVSPTTNQGKQAEEYLMQLIEDNVVECSIVAYSMQGIATAYCSVGATSINHALVENGFSKNVSLGE